MSNSYKIYASKDYVNERGLPQDAGEYKQLVTGADGEWTVEDRLAWKEVQTVEIMPEETLAFSNQMATVNNSQLASVAETIGTECTVTFDGVDYKCVSTSIDDGLSCFVGNLYKFAESQGANPNDFGLTQDTGEPFVIIPNTSGVIFLVFDASVQSATVSVAAKMEVYTPISHEYLPIAENTDFVCYAYHKGYTMTVKEAEQYEALFAERKIFLLDWQGSEFSNVKRNTDNGFDFYLAKDIQQRPLGVYPNDSGEFDRPATYPSTLVKIHTNSGFVVAPSRVTTLASGSEDFFIVKRDGATGQDFAVQKDGVIKPFAIILPSATTDSIQKYRVTVDDTGKLSTTNTEDSTTVTMMPEIPVTTEDNGKVLGVVEGSIDLVTLTATDVGAEPTITTLDVTKGGTGYNTIADTTYTTARYRASALVNAETDPTVNGVINWQYE